MIGKHWKVASLLMLLVTAEVWAKKKKGKCKHDCCIVVNLWKHFGKSTSVDPNSSTACCSMSGVLCWNGRVRNIRWKNQGLTGSIPSWINKLKNLVILQLGSNQLSGSIPASIGDLKILYNLMVERNRLSGQIPSSIGKMKSLRWLFLQENQLSGPIPASFGGLSNAGALNFAKNQLSGQVPSSIGYLPRVWAIRFDHNPNLSGTFRTRALVLSHGTQVIVCGSTASNTPGSLYGNAHPNCLSVSSSTLRKRNTIPSYHHVYGGVKYTFSCTINHASNPYQDCINHMAFACYTLGSSACKDVVDARFAKFNRHWKGMLNSCARWKTGNTSGCEASLADLRKNAWYYVPGVGQVRPDIIFTNSLRDQLWSKVA
jgi:hypothetical protein